MKQVAQREQWTKVERSFPGELNIILYGGLETVRVGIQCMFRNGTLELTTHCADMHSLLNRSICNTFGCKDGVPLVECRGSSVLECAVKRCKNKRSVTNVGIRASD